MTPIRRAALAGGVFYLITFASSIPSWFFLQPVLSDPNYVLGAGADTQVAIGALLDVVTAFAGIGCAVALWSVIKRAHEGLALGYLTTRLMEGALIMMGVLAELAVVTLRQGGTAGADEASMVAAGRSLVAVHDWSFLFGPGLMPVFNALMLATLLYRARLVPRLIPAMGLIGAPLLAASTLGTMFGVNDTQSAFTGLATMPIFFWELSVGLWMTFKGFRSSAPILSADASADVRETSGAPAAAQAGAA
jgi:Domain of unknown function (DUF4386)